MTLHRMKCAIKWSLSGPFISYGVERKDIEWIYIEITNMNGYMGHFNSTLLVMLFCNAMWCQCILFGLCSLLCTKLPYNRRGYRTLRWQRKSDMINTVHLFSPKVSKVSVCASFSFSFKYLFGHFWMAEKLTAWEAGMDDSNSIVGIALKTLHTNAKVWFFFS